MSLFNNAIIGASGQGGYRISRSVRLRSSASAYLSRTLTTPTDRKKWTWSGWIKRSNFPATYVHIFGTGTASSDTATTQIQFYQDNLYLSGFSTGWLKTNAVYRDPSAWYHIVVAWDNANATASNRCKIFVNGVETTYAVDNRASLSTTTDYGMNYATLHTIGAWSWNNGTFAQPEYFDGYMTEINFIDGQALTPSSFGETNSVTGVWQPKKYGGTYGTNGFYLNFSDNSNNTATTIGKDYSGNGNNWTPNNISVTAGVTYDSMIDVPTLYSDGGNGRGNYCVLNPLDFNSGTVSNGNLQWVTSAAVGNGCFGTFAFDIADSTNKYYWEMTLTSGDVVFGIVPLTTLPSNTSRTGSYSYYTNGNKYSGTTPSAYGASFTSGDVIGVAVGNGIITFYKNNVSQGSAFTGLTGFFKPAIWEVSGTFNANFGQRPFTYTPPTGFVALNTQNLPTPTISNGATVMAATTYTGTGATQTIANSGNNAASISFKPDWVWIKSRSAATNNNLFDSVRGTTNYLISNSTAAEATNANTLTAFGTTGFTLGSDASALGVNVNAATYVAWQWQAGQGSTSSNTSGSITSTVSVNATAGFSVVTYTGTGSGGSATVGHGLGVQPSMVILKSRTVAGQNWGVAHVSIPNSRIALQSTAAATTGGGTYGEINYQSTFTSSVIKFLAGSTNSDAVNGSGQTYVAYCFAAVAGYSAFGSYTGNGSTDGPFIYTGFRPRFIMFKKSSGVDDWEIIDTSRNLFNVNNNGLAPNTSAAEITNRGGDVLSNGFKLRYANGTTNESGFTYIYAAFAENPFKISLAR